MLPLEGEDAHAEGAVEQGDEVGDERELKEDDNVESDSLLHDLWSGTTSKMDQIIDWIKSLFWTETHGDNGFSTTSKIEQIIDKVKAAQGQADTNENVTERTESETTFTTSTPITPFSNNFRFNLSESTYLNIKNIR